MPPRLQAVVRLSDWFVHGKNDKIEKRMHTKTYGCISLVELARQISKNWKQAGENEID